MDMFTTEELQEMKQQVGEAGFPTKGNTETQVFCALVQANAQIKLANAIEDAAKVIRDGVKVAGGQICDSIDALKGV
jgi:hypothetical protein